jgi:ribA/ribD-fused uncharacterized protein
MTTEPLKYFYFWKPQDPNGWAGQWHKAAMTAPSTTNPSETVTYPTAEHYMMYHKALLFNDPDVATQILEATDPKDVKALGRMVKDFDDDTWKDKRYQIVVDGNFLKFRQHDNLRKLLLETEGSFIVEASPRDRIWGIGFGAKNALANKERWGLNLLGKALMEVRTTFLEEAKGGASEVQEPKL